MCLIFERLWCWFPPPVDSLQTTNFRNKYAADDDNDDDDNNNCALI